MDAERLKSLWNRKNIRITGLLVLAFVLLYFFYRMSSVFTPVFAALILAYILNPIVDFFEKKGIGRTWTVIGLFFIVALAALLMVAIAIPALVSEASSFAYMTVGDIPVEPAAGDEGKYPSTSEPFEDEDGNQKYTEGETFTDYDHDGVYDGVVYYEDGNGNGSFDEGYIGRIKRSAEGAFESLDNLLKKSGAPGVDADYLFETVTEKARDNAGRIASTGWDVGGRIFGAISSGLSTLLYIFVLAAILPLYTFFFLKDFPKIKQTVRDHLPFKYKERTLDVAGKIDSAMGGFFRGLLLICTIKAILFIIGYSIIGVKFAFLLGLLAGAMTIIPWFGCLIAVSIAAVIAYLDGGSTTLMLTLVFYVVVDQADGLIISPWVYGKSVKLHPVVIIVSLFFFGNLFGFFGMLVAVPLAAITQIAFVEFVLPPLKELAKEPAGEEST